MKNEIETAAKEARREYLKQWRKAHPEKIREYNIKYWIRRAEREMRERERQENIHE